jgi:hypothetical protein
MSGFSKELRQEIVREFAIRHNGHYNPRLFIDEVRSAGEGHPAYGWFQWDREKAALEHWLWQAREFANGLKVSFTVEELNRDQSITVREFEMPFALSPVAGRRSGGGYMVNDQSDPAHMAELCRQAATGLAGWLRRYEAAIAHAGGSLKAIEKQIRLLKAACADESEEAA